MRGPYGFDDQLAIGVAGELVSKRYLESMPAVAAVEHHPGRNAVQRDGIDLYCVMDGKRISIEVKTDEQAHKTGNYAFETWSVEAAGIRGGFLTSKADLLHYHIKGTRELHVMDLTRVRKWFQKSKADFRRVETPNEGYTTINRLVPIERVLRECADFVSVHDVSRVYGAMVEDRITDPLQAAGEWAGKPAREVLRQVFGFEDFRAGQADVIQALIEGQDAMALMPTGGGKSLCYQVPSLVRPGVGVVISPLIALMTDQVSALKAAGARAAAIHSGMARPEIAETLIALRTGTLDILYVAPERAQNPAFRAVLRESAVALVAVDEAHCVDKWGHDFRENYLGLHALRADTGTAPWFACTATADHRSLQVIEEQLKLRSPTIVQGSYDRPNLHYEIVPNAARHEDLSQWIQANHSGETGIVYCRSRARCEQLAGQLEDGGIQATAYHAGLDDEHRRRIEGRFRDEDAIVVCATVAFGMGIDRSDVRFVVHAEPPDSMDAYVQETGRAGRDGIASNVRLYVDGRTIARTAKSLDADNGDEAQTKRNRFRAFLGYLEATTCRRQVLLGFFGEDHPGSCNRCDNCLHPPQTWDAQTPAGLALDAAQLTGQRFGSTYLIELLQGKDTERIRRNGHSALDIAGRGAEWSAEQWKLVFRHLTARGVLRADQHGSLRISGEAPSNPLLLPLPKKKRQTPKVKENAPASSADAGLLAELKKHRLAVAQRDSLPAFVIFHDSTLHEMASAKPSDAEAFLQLTGVGKVKLERYGDGFMECIRAHERATADTG